MKKQFFELLFSTLDEVLNRTRSFYNQVKILSSMKANEKGHSSDTFADTLSKIILAVIFMFREKKNVQSVQTIMDSAMECRGKESVNVYTVAADRGYGKEVFLNKILNFGRFGVHYRQ